MALTRKQFDVLVALKEAGERLSQRELARRTGFSLGTVNALAKSLTQEGLLADGQLTEKGAEALEPYKVRRAVFLAAGFGARLAPASLSTPKPLVTVNGVRIVDTLLDACLKVGIEEIVMVRGYKAEMFEELLEKYPMIRFVDNPRYTEANNILSAWYARDLLQNAYICDADLVVENPGILKLYHYQSDFLGIPTARTDDCFFAVKNGIIQQEQIGGENGYLVVGISYWNAEDGARLEADLDRALKSPGGSRLYWEQVPLLVYKNDYRVAVRECRAEDITEIDTFEELCALDPSYRERYAAQAAELFA